MRRSRVHARNGAAACPDLDHLDGRDAQRQAASLQEPVLPRHLEIARQLRTVVVDQADFRRGAAHVEGERLVETVFGGDIAGQHRTAGRARLDQPDRETAAPFRDRGDRTARHGEQQRAGKAPLPERGFEPADIARDQRADIGIGHGGRKAVVFADLGGDFRGQADRGFRQFAFQDRGRAAFMAVVHIGMQETDRDRLDALFPEERGMGGDRLFVEGP